MSRPRSRSPARGDMNVSISIGREMEILGGEKIAAQIAKQTDRMLVYTVSSYRDWPPVSTSFSFPSHKDLITYIKQKKGGVMTYNLSKDGGIVIDLGDQNTQVFVWNFDKNKLIQDLHDLDIERED